MTRLRVVHVVDSLAATGGAEQRLVEEIEALVDRFDQHVVRLYERDDLQRRVERSGVPVTALGFSARQAGRTWPVAARRLRAVLAAQRPDVVHTTLFSGNLVGQLAARRLGIPVLSSFNRTGDIALQRAHQPGVAGWRGRTMQAVARRVARRDDVRFRAVSADAAATNGALFAVPPERISVVPRGISVDGVAGGRPSVVRAARRRAAVRQRGPPRPGEGADAARRGVRRSAPAPPGRPAGDRRSAGRRRARRP